MKLGLLFAIAVILAGIGNRCEGAGQGGDQNQAPSVAGEVIVKFKENSKAGKMVQEALGAGAQTDPALAAYVATLSREIRIPFQAKQLTSGGEVVLSVQQQELISHLLEKLKQNRHVSEAGPLDEKTLPQKTGNQVRVIFRRGTREAKAVAKAPPDSKSLEPDIRKFIDGLEKQLGWSVVPRVTEKQLVLTLDVKAVTSTLIERLKERDDIQYAQPNFLLQKIGVGASL